MDRYQTIRVGDRAELVHTITQRDLERFVELSGDDNKLHVDHDFAGSTVYKKPVAHGMLGVSFISTMIGTKLPGDGALWFAQNLEFLLPVRVGDTITVSAEVLSKQDRDRIVELRTDIFNQHKQKVTAGVAKVKIIEQLPAEELKAPAPAQRALVVGASGGIGSAICLQLAADGYDVAIHYRSNPEPALRLKEQIAALGRRALVVAGDITDFDQVRELTAQACRGLGGLSLLVNCATVKIPTIRFSALEWSDLQGHLDANVKGMFNLAKCVVPVFEAQRSGKIVLFTTQAVETPSPGWSHYITAKSALQGFAKALAVELAPKGITVNLVSPGMTETELIADIPEKARLVAASKTPLRRLGRPEDIAGAVSFLASEKSAYLTGETLRINGGQVML